jgi:hypothetical protein
MPAMRMTIIMAAALGQIAELATAQTVGAMRASITTLLLSRWWVNTAMLHVNLVTGMDSTKGCQPVVLLVIKMNTTAGTAPIAKDVIHRRDGETDKI